MMSIDTQAQQPTLIPQSLLQSSEPIQELLDTASLYLHVPFCHTRCYYCDFNTFAGLLPLREPYVKALITEIGLAGQMAQHADGRKRRSRTVFLGGGTPSLLQVEQIQRIIAACFESFAIDADAEITMEANPGTLNREQLIGVRKTGINRLSMGERQQAGAA